MDKIDTCMTVGVLTFIGVLVLLIVVLNLKCCDRRRSYDGGGYGYMRMEAESDQTRAYLRSLLGKYTVMGADHALPFVQNTYKIPVVFVVLDDPPNHTKWDPIFSQVAAQQNLTLIGVSRSYGFFRFGMDSPAVHNYPYLMPMDVNGINLNPSWPYGMQGEPMTVEAISAFLAPLNYYASNI